VRRVRALDGIRAIAVGAVMAYHFGVGGFGGGFLGVDVFFVLSGFLITALLVAEYQRSATVSFKAFYARRARRLLPGLFGMFVLVALFAAYFAQAGTLQTIRGDAFATLAYVANWRFIFGHQSYFVASGPPSPLLHMWSLGVEEQFYLLWPAVAVWVLKRKGPGGLALTAAIGAVASAVDTAVLLHNGASNTRLYFGTDVHAQSLMVGAALGALLPLSKPAATSGLRSIEAPRRRWLDAAVSLLGLMGLAGTCWAFHSASGTSPVLYEGGYLALALGVGALILAVTRTRDGALARVLSFGPLAYIGQISYGLYLYHWPISLMLTSTRAGLLGWQLAAARTGATLAVSVLSYHLLEAPIRRGSFLRGWRAGALVPVAVAGTVATLLVASGVPVAEGSAAAVVRAERDRSVSCASLAARGAPCVTPSTAAAAGLAPNNPVRVLLLGDSIALTLGQGLGVDDRHWDVSIDDQGRLGCDLDAGSVIDDEGSITVAGDGIPGQGCLGWPQLFTRLVDRTDPDVVAIEVGRWEVENRIVGGHWVRFGAPVLNRLMVHLMSEAISVVSRRGAHVVLFTLPYIKQTFTQPNGQPWDIDRPKRTNEFNALVRQAAAQHPKTATVIDLNRLLDPAGHYTNVIDGIRVRWPDEEHISVAGGEYLRPLILPELAALGLPHALARQRNALGTGTPR